MSACVLLLAEQFYMLLLLLSQQAANGHNSLLSTFTVLCYSSAALPAAHCDGRCIITMPAVNVRADSHHASDGHCWLGLWYIM
jgi:hypothetical protein